MAAVVAVDGVAVVLVVEDLAVVVAVDLADSAAEARVAVAPPADGRLFIVRGKNTMHKKSRTYWSGFFNWNLGIII
jgi:hypothetical protein